MNYTFKRFVGFKRITSDGFDRKLALKNSVLFLILSKLLKIMYFFLILLNCWNTGVTFNLLMRQKKIFYRKDNEANP